MKYMILTLSQFFQLDFKDGESALVADLLLIFQFILENPKMESRAKFTVSVCTVIAY